LCQSSYAAKGGYAAFKGADLRSCLVVEPEHSGAAVASQQLFTGIESDGFVNTSLMRTLNSLHHTVGFVGDLAVLGTGYRMSRWECKSLGIDFSHAALFGARMRKRTQRAGR